MKIIIVGMGSNGVHFAELVAAERHDVVVIDSNQEKVNWMTDHYNVNGVCGNGASRNTLMKAGADTADILIALTDVDEVNMIACKTAKDCGTCYAAAKAENQDIFENKEYWEKEYSVDYVVNIKRITADAIARQIGLPAKLKAAGFFGKDEVIIGMTVDENSGLQGKTLREVRAFLGENILVATVCRKGKLIVPKGNFRLLIADEVTIIANRQEVLAIARKMGYIQKPIKNVLIVGGGIVGQNLAEGLLKEHKKVKILERRQERCQELRSLLPEEVDVSLVEDIDAQVLTKEGIHNANVCVCLTGQDETNLIISLFAWSCGVGSVITQVKTPSYEALLNKVNINITISPVGILADSLLAFVRNVAVYNDKGNDINMMYHLAGGLGEAIEFIAYENSRGIGVLFKSPDFATKDDVLVGGLIRNGKMMIPDGESAILPGDHVIVITKTGHGLATLEDIFK